VQRPSVQRPSVQRPSVQRPSRLQPNRRRPWGGSNSMKPRSAPRLSALPMPWRWNSGWTSAPACQPRPTKQNSSRASPCPAYRPRRTPACQSCGCPPGRPQRRSIWTSWAGWCGSWPVMPQPWRGRRKTRP